MLLFLGLGEGNLEVFERQLPVVLAQLFGFLAVDRVIQLGDQMLKALDDVLQFRGPRGCHLQSLEGRAVIRRQNGQIKVFGSSGHGRVYSAGSKP